MPKGQSGSVPRTDTLDVAAWGFWDLATISTVASEGMSACPWGICH